MNKSWKKLQKCEFWLCGIQTFEIFYHELDVLHWGFSTVKVTRSYLPFPVAATSMYCWYIWQHLQTSVPFSFFCRKRSWIAVHVSHVKYLNIPELLASILPAIFELISCVHQKWGILLWWKKAHVLFNYKVKEIVFMITVLYHISLRVQAVLGLRLWRKFRVDSSRHLRLPKTVWALKIYISCVIICCSIYTVHDEVKDKAFELELSWVSEGQLQPAKMSISIIFGLILKIMSHHSARVVYYSEIKNAGLCWTEVVQENIWKLPTI
mgnify:CR=1 FL=1